MENSVSVRRKIVLLVLGLVLTASLVLIALLYMNYEVIAKGQLLPYTEGRIYQVRFFDRFDLWVEPEHRLSANAITAFLLSGLGFVALAFAWLLQRMRANGEALMFGLIFVGASYLAADEYLGVHESIGHNLPFLRAIPGVSRPDDVVTALYIIPAALFVWIYRKKLMVSKPALKLIAAAFVFFGLATITDLTQWPGEEVLEAAAALSFLLAFLQIGSAHTELAARASA